MIPVTHRQNHIKITLDAERDCFKGTFPFPVFILKEKTYIAASTNFFMINTMNLVRLCHKQAPATPHGNLNEGPGDGGGEAGCHRPPRTIVILIYLL